MFGLNAFQGLFDQELMLRLDGVVGVPRLVLWIWMDWNVETYADTLCMYIYLVCFYYFTIYIYIYIYRYIYIYILHNEYIHMYIYIYIYIFKERERESVMILDIMWLKQWHRPSMTWKGNHTTYKNGDFGEYHQNMLSCGTVPPFWDPEMPIDTIRYPWTIPNQ